jgi:lipopolysaccharide biosynthesis glycosyltransferase
MSDNPGNAVRRAVRRVRGLTRQLASPSTQQPAKAPETPARPARKGIDPRFRRAYWRIARNVLGESAMPATPEALEFDPAVAGPAARAARNKRALALFAEMISTGDPIDLAHAETVRALIRADKRHTARAFTLGLRDLPDGEVLENVGIGIAVHSLALYEQAWDRFRQVDVERLAALASVEAVQCALTVGTEDAVDVALRIASDPTALGHEDLVEVAGRFVAVGRVEVARTLVDEADARDPDDLSEHHAEMLDNLHRWTHPEPAPEPPAGAVRIAVMDYHSPDLVRSSQNVGDYVQTLAMLGNLARFQRTRWTGEDGLGELITELQGRVRPELALDAGDADVHVLPVSRDHSLGDPVPENTWMVAFGWHMHSLFRIRFGLPYHPNLNPLFLSFHVQRVGALTPEAIEYLKAHGPIGCRDWTTVDLLLSAGVDAFFTGCLTTTISAVFPHLADVERDEDRVVGVIDYPVSQVKAAKRSIEWISHGDAAYRAAGLVEGTRAAVDLLAGYQKRYQRIVTSRLHSYLPATSLGLKVTFRPKVPGDVRFEGLYGMKPQQPAFEEMRDGIRHLIKETFELVLAGADRDTVYARWRELTADKVAEAKARFQEPARAIEPRFDLAATVARIREGARAYGPHDRVDAARVTDVAMSLDQNLRDQLPVTIESVVENASGPVRLWITARGLTPAYEQWLSDAFPDVPMTFLVFDDVDYGVIGRMIQHITVATMDRLLLPEVLTDLDRITYIDIDTVTEGDVVELAATDLAGLPLAARTSVYPGSQIWRSAGDLLDPETAAELRRTMSARHAFDFRTFNAGVLVLDLARMRKDGFTETHVPLAGEFGLNDQDILNAYVGPDRVELDTRWNALPVQEVVSKPGVIHYAGLGKPWEDELTAYAERWQVYADRFRARAGRPPA